MKSYATLAQIKDAGWLGIPSTNTDSDTTILRVLGNVSLEIDKLIHRWCECREETRLYTYRHYPGAHVEPVVITDDILSVSSILLDTNADGSYADTMAATDYLLEPLNGYPKYMIKPTLQSNFPGFAENVPAGIKVMGVFGYGDGLSATPYQASGATVKTGGIDGSSTTLNLATGGGAFLLPGMTGRLDSEQFFISAVSGDAATILRPQNGTTAAAHIAGTAVYIYQYPGEIVESTLIQATRWWKRRLSAFQDVIISPDQSQIQVYKGLDPDVKMMLNAFIKRVPWR